MSSYLTENTIAANPSMQYRVAQAVAHEGGLGTDPVTGFDYDPDRWAAVNRRYWAAAPGWGDAWDSAVVSNPDPEFDPGADPGVITDAMILSQIQTMI